MPPFVQKVESAKKSKKIKKNCIFLLTNKKEYAIIKAQRLRDGQYATTAKSESVPRVNRKKFLHMKEGQKNDY
jgi:hypothetical protein